MYITKTYRYRLKLTNSQQEQVDSLLHTCRAIYNLALETKMYAYRSNRVSLSQSDLQKQLTELKREKGYEWIKEVPSDSLQEVIERLDKTYKKFFSGGGFPKFSNRDKYKSITFKRVSRDEDNGSRVILPNLGSVKFFWSRDMEGELRRATIKKENGKYYISIVTRQELDTTKIYYHSDNQAVGIDMGVENFLVTSDGEFVDNPRFLQSHKRQMRILQRKLARQKKLSYNWYRTKTQISKLHLKTKNQRKDFLHKSANSLLSSYDFISAEKLNLKNMTKSAKGTIEEPGKNVKQKAGLNRSMLDLGLGMFFKIVNYKSEWQGKMLVQINPAYTSQQCSACYHVEAGNRKSQSEFLCLACGYKANADYNAAKNILREGISHFRQREALACA